MKTIALLGGDGGDLGALADVPIVVPATETQRIQEVHILVIHLLCELIEDQLLTTASGILDRPENWTFEVPEVLSAAPSKPPKFLAPDASFSRTG